MSKNFPNETLKDAAIAKQQIVVNNAAPTNLAEAQAELAVLQSATVSN